MTAPIDTVRQQCHDGHESVEGTQAVDYLEPPSRYGWNTVLPDEARGPSVLRQYAPGWSRAAVDVRRGGHPCCHLPRVSVAVGVLMGWWDRSGSWITSRALLGGWGIAVCAWLYPIGWPR